MQIVFIILLRVKLRPALSVYMGIPSFALCHVNDVTLQYVSKQIICID